MRGLMSFNEGSYDAPLRPSLPMLLSLITIFPTLPPLLSSFFNLFFTVHRVLFLRNSGDSAWFYYSKRHNHKGLFLLAVKNSKATV